MIDPPQRDFLAALEAADLVRLRDLIAAGANVNLTGIADGETPLIRAIGSGQVNVVQLLLQAGADPNLRQNGGQAWTPLMFAFEKPEVIAELIKAGADVNARTPVSDALSPASRMMRLIGGETALHLAAAANNAQGIKLLAQAGAELESK